MAGESGEKETTFDPVYSRLGEDNALFRKALYYVKGYPRARRDSLYTWK